VQQKITPKVFAIISATSRNFEVKLYTFITCS